jgi:hypothetical protein
MAVDTVEEAVGKLVEGTVIVIKSIVKAVSNFAEGTAVAIRSTAEVVDKSAEGTVIVVVIEIVGTEVGRIGVEALVMDKLGLQVGASPSKAVNNQFQFVFHQDVR